MSSVWFLYKVNMQLQILVIKFATTYQFCIKNKRNSLFGSFKNNLKAQTSNLTSRVAEMLFWLTIFILKSPIPLYVEYLGIFVGIIFLSQYCLSFILLKLGHFFPVENTSWTRQRQKVIGQTFVCFVST